MPLRGFRPRKSLGQAFLTHEPTADALVKALGAGHDDTVLEIGPGRGILTRRLVGCVRALIAVEIDPRLVEGLLAEFRAESTFRVIRGDFLKYDLAQHRELLVIGNLPYNLSSQMLFRLLECRDSWRIAVLTVQREFAQRLLAQPGRKEYGAITVITDRLAERERLFNIQPSCFKPRPAVVSTALRLRRRAVPTFAVNDEELFRKVLRVCFSQRRKTIANNLLSGFGLSRPKVEWLLSACGIDPAARAETVPGEKFGQLATLIGSEKLASSVAEALGAASG